MFLTPERFGKNMLWRMVTKIIVIVPWQNLTLSMF